MLLKDKKEQKWPNISPAKSAFVHLATKHAELVRGTFNPREKQVVNRSEIGGHSREISFLGTLQGADPNVGSIALYKIESPVKPKAPTTGMVLPEANFGVLIRSLYGLEENQLAERIGEQRGVKPSLAYAAELLVPSHRHPEQLVSTGASDVFIPLR